MAKQERILSPMLVEAGIDDPRDVEIAGVRKLTLKEIMAGVGHTVLKSAVRVGMGRKRSDAEAFFDRPTVENRGIQNGAVDQESWGDLGWVEVEEREQ